jgi:hypothetical protein
MGNVNGWAGLNIFYQAAEVHGRRWLATGGEKVIKTLTRSNGILHQPALININASTAGIAQSMAAMEQLPTSFWDRLIFAVAILLTLAAASALVAAAIIWLG